MLKLIRETWDNFLHNEAWVIARVRAVIFFFASGGLAFAHDIGQEVQSERVEHWVKIAAILSMAIAARMAAGDKTPENVKALSDSMGKPVDGQ